jgi:hypothetical protein
MGFGPQLTKRWFVISAAVGAAAIVGGWTAALNSDSYAVARDVTRQSPEVAQAFGTVNDISLRGFTMTWDDAEFRMAVNGARAKGTVSVSLKKDPIWRVERLRMQP